jgi:all-trans-retinol dehydrogenase (NAD+)
MAKNSPGPVFALPILVLGSLLAGTKFAMTGLSIARVISVLLMSFYQCLRSFVTKRPKPNFNCDVVLITGAAQGLGKELALQFSDCGATVILWDVDEAKLHQTCSKITAKGRDAFGYVVDCSNKHQVYETAEKIKEDIGNVSILINNAGIFFGKLITELQDDEIERTLNVNYISHYWTVRAFLPWMMDNDYGHIVEISSVAAYIGGPSCSDYSSECLRL